MARRNRAFPALAAAVALLGGCDQIRTPINGLFAAPEPPDAFLVLSRAPLRMPPSMALPEPRPGETSPLEPTPLTDAQVALLGRPATPAGTAPSAGERALLDAADAAAAQPDIREVLAIESDPDLNEGPYEPPSIFALVFGEDTIEPEDVIDPTVESRRLAAEGFLTPVDPDEVLPRSNDPRPEDPTSYVTDRRGEQPKPAWRW